MPRRGLAGTEGDGRGHNMHMAPQPLRRKSTVTTGNISDRQTYTNPPTSAVKYKAQVCNRVEVTVFFLR